MKQDELWLKKFQKVMTFIETNHRNPERHNPVERGLYINSLKQNRKMFNVGKMKEERVVLFLKLMEVGERYKRANQYL